MKIEQMEKLMRIIQKLDNPKKTKEAYKYKYADLSQVKDMVQEAAQDEGCCIFENIATLDGETNGGTYLQLSLLDGQDELLLCQSSIPESSDPQFIGSWITYMRRYHLLTAFSMAPEDDDGAVAHDIAGKPDEGNNQALKQAKRELWDAVKAYAAKTNVDPNEIITGIKGAPDYRETTAYLLSVAQQYKG